TPARGRRSHLEWTDWDGDRHAPGTGPSIRRLTGAHRVGLRGSQRACPRPSDVLAFAWLRSCASRSTSRRSNKRTPRAVLMAGRVPLRSHCRTVSGETLRIRAASVVRTGSTIGWCVFIVVLMVEEPRCTGYFLGLVRPCSALYSALRDGKREEGLSGSRISACFSSARFRRP